MRTGAAFEIVGDSLLRRERTAEGGCAVETVGDSGSGQDHGAGSPVDGQHEEDGRELSRTETKEEEGDQGGGAERMNWRGDQRSSRSA